MSSWACHAGRRARSTSLSNACLLAITARITPRSSANFAAREPLELTRSRPRTGLTSEEVTRQHRAARRSGLSRRIMSPERPRAARVPPRWIVRSAWVVHRAIYRFSGGRLGLTSPRPGKYGMLRLKTIGRRSGKQHSVILAYYEDGPGSNLVTLAMNGWASG